MEIGAMIERQRDRTMSRVRRWLASAGESLPYLVLVWLTAMYVAGVIARIMTSRY